MVRTQETHDDLHNWLDWSATTARPASRSPTFVLAVFDLIYTAFFTVTGGFARCMMYSTLSLYTECCFVFFIFKSSNSLSIRLDGTYPHIQDDPFSRQHYTVLLFSRVKTAVVHVTVKWSNSFSGWRVVSLQPSASQAVPNYLYLYSPCNTSWLVLGWTSPLPFTVTWRVNTLWWSKAFDIHVPEH